MRLNWDGQELVIETPAGTVRLSGPAVALDYVHEALWEIEDLSAGMERPEGRLDNLEDRCPFCADADIAIGSAMERLKALKAFVRGLPPDGRMKSEIWVRLLEVEKALALDG